MLHALAIAVGGSCGALGRYFLSKIITDSLGAVFPWGTLVVNSLGCLVLGFFYALFENVIVAVELRSFLTIGFLGAFTTFSTFALESVNLFQKGEIALGALNIVLSLVSGIIFLLVGMLVGNGVTQK